jgi:hypothetical protein
VPGEEDTLKPRTRNGIVHNISNDNGVRIVNFIKKLSL